MNDRKLIRPLVGIVLMMVVLAVWPALPLRRVAEAAVAFVESASTLLPLD